MNISRTYIAAALAAATLSAPLAQGSIPHEPGSASGTTAGPATVHPAAPPYARLDGSLPPETRPVAAGKSSGATTVSATVRPAAPPYARLDGSLPPETRPIVIAGGSGFDWTDAGIGFAVAAGLALLGAGALATVHWRRQGGLAAS